MAPQCLCLSQMPSFAIFLVGCREPGRTRSTLFRDGVWRLWGSRGVSRAPCSPQYWPIVDIDVASDSHRPASDMNAIGTYGKGSRRRGAEGTWWRKEGLCALCIRPPASQMSLFFCLLPVLLSPHLPYAIGFLSSVLISLFLGFSVSPLPL